VNKGGEQVEEWLELANGCICCSVKDQGVNAIESLMERSGKFDYILLETTGLADPGNLAPLFWVDDGLLSTIYLDGIVTLVDAKNILKSLDEPPPETVHQQDHERKACDTAELTTAHLQISHADIIVLNKSDLVSPAQLEQVMARIRSINGLAKMHTTSHSRIPKLEGVLLDIHAYDRVSADDVDFAAKGHSHLDPTISTISIPVPPLSSSNLDKVDEWLRRVLWESALPNSELSFEVHRAKGRLVTESGQVMLLQGVRDVFELVDSPDTSNVNDGAMPGKLILIGRGLHHTTFEQSFYSTLQITSSICAQ